MTPTTNSAVTTHRSPSWKARVLYWLARSTLRHLYRAWPMTESGIRGLAAVERAFTRLPHPSGVRIEHDELGGVPVLTTAPGGGGGECAVEDLAVLYIHGGAFVFCGPGTHRRVCAGLAVHLQAPVYAVQYRMLPEVDMATVVQDVYTAYRALSEQLTDRHRIVVAGDSAGGFLSAKLCELAALDGIRRPAAMVGYSPLYDLDCDLEDGTWLHRDAYQPASTMRRAQKLWAPDRSRFRGTRSILDVDPEHLPPTLITVAAGELVEADALTLTSRLHSAGRTVETHRWYTTVHAFPVLGALLPESRQARDLTSTFLRRMLDRR